MMSYLPISKSLKINLSIIGLTDTWLTNNCTNMSDVPSYKFITANRENKTGCGKMDCKIRKDLSLFDEDT